MSYLFEWWFLRVFNHFWICHSRFLFCNGLFLYSIFFKCWNIWLIFNLFFSHILSLLRLDENIHELLTEFINAFIHRVWRVWFCLLYLGLSPNQYLIFFFYFENWIVLFLSVQVFIIWWLNLRRLRFCYILINWTFLSFKFFNLWSDNTLLIYQIP